MKVKKFFAILSGMVFLSVGIIFISKIGQNVIISFVESVLHKTRENTSLKLYLNRISLLCFLFSLCSFGFIFYKSEYFNKLNCKYDLYKIFSLCFVFFFLILFIFPFIIYGENSVITIHDNLDDSIPRFKYIHDNKLFLAFNRNLPVMDNISTLFFNREGYTVYNAIYCLLPSYMGYVTNYFLCLILSFLSFYYMQQLIFKTRNIAIVLTSIMYAVLPVVSCYAMGVSTLPFCFVILYKLLKTDSKKWLPICFLFPFFSEFSAVGINICIIWLSFFVCYSIKNKQVNRRVILGFFLLCIGYLFTISRLVYMRLFTNVLLNRDYFSITPEPFYKTFISFIVDGFYHAGTNQNPFVNIVVIIGVIKSIYDFIINKIKLEKSFLILLSLYFLFSLIAALSEVGIIGNIASILIPPLKGLSFSRIYIINRVIIYLLFTTCMIKILHSNQYISIVLCIIQIGILFIGGLGFSPSKYSDAVRTYCKKMTQSDEITWKDFYSSNQFNQIKYDINYSGEKVCAVGFHPGVLLYNGFNTIDGYLSVYEYEDQIHWHNLMKPEFSVNEKDREYFDSWGGRRYIYNNGISYTPTAKKQHPNIALRVDMSILKNEFDCKYILSRAEILNSDKLNLQLVNCFISDDYFYNIWEYKIID